MNLLRKYYDKDSIGGGIPDEVDKSNYVRRKKALQMIEQKADSDFKSSGTFGATSFGLDGIPFVRRKAIADIMILFSDSELSLASEEISRLKAEILSMKNDYDNGYRDGTTYSSNLYEGQISRLKEEVEWLTIKKQTIFDILSNVAKRRMDRIIELKAENERLRGGVCTGEEYECYLATMIENIPQNRPLYKDSGLWQIRTDDMEEVLYQQGVDESFFNFISRAYEKENNFIL